MKGIGTILSKKYGELCFGLTGGIAYYMIILQFILDNTKNAGGLLALFLAPVIICFPAIVLIKFTRELKEKERYREINLLIWAHIALFIISLLAVITRMM